MKILAIETSHDDTSVVLYQDRQIIWEQSISQTTFHQQFGGTIPEYAARLHLDNLALICDNLLKFDNLATIDYVAYTAKPGLIGALQMGRLFGYGLSCALNKPIVPVNHLHGHVFAIEFTSKVIFPALALIVSGGHSQIWLVKSYRDLQLIGETQDDALGEVYDKVARALNLGFPGGPVIDKLSQSYDDDFINFEIKPDSSLKLSFSGLKTKVLNVINSRKNLQKPINPAQIAASFQFYAIKYVLETFRFALNEHSVASIILGGGVAANSYLRTQFAQMHPNALIPALQYTTDNAAMIAITCHLQLDNNL